MTTPSLAQRMRRLQNEIELHELFEEVRREGSPNWTLSLVEKRVPEALWPALREHFAADGTILPPGEEGEPLIDRHQRGQEEEPKGGLDSSVLALIEDLHRELWVARRPVPSTHEAPDTIRPRTSSAVRQVEGSRGRVWVPVSDRTTDEDIRAAAEASAVSGHSGGSTKPSARTCPICDEDAPTLVTYRGKELCPDCRELLRG